MALQVGELEKRPPSKKFKPLFLEIPEINFHQNSQADAAQGCLACGKVSGFNSTTKNLRVAGSDFRLGGP